MTDEEGHYIHNWTNADEQEPEGEEWHSKIHHEDQADFTFPEPEPEPEPQIPAEANPDVQAPDPALEPPVIPPTFLELWNQRIRKFLANSTNFYATVGVGLGILCGIIIAAVSWHMSNPAGAYDLGPVAANGAGLTGRLFAKWDEKLQYRLTIEPSYKEQVPGFSLAVGNPPRPLAIEIHLQDSQGFVLCGKEIVLKYDPRNPAALAASSPSPQTGTADEGTASNGQAATGIDFAKLDAQEAAREKGKDLFQSQVGPDGQIESISSQGELPCSRSSYEKATNWSFTPDFPSLAEQNAMLQRLGETPASATSPSSEPASTRRRRASKPAPNTSLFFVEGDDSIVDFDASTGIVATRGGRNFSIDKAGAEANALKGHDFPMRVHYRCDQTAACTITTDGAGVLRARLRR